MAINLDKFTIVSYDQITAFKNGKLRLQLDELTDAEMSNSQESTEITGKGGRVISRLKKNKSVTFTATNGMICGGAIGAQVGSEFEDGTHTIKYTDVITVNSDKGVTTQKAIGTAGDEIGIIYVRDDASNAFIEQGKKLTQVAATPATGEFSYDPETKEITFFAGDIADGVEVIAFYETEVEGYKLTNDANNFSEVLETYIDVTCQDACDNQFHGQYIMKRGDFSGEFSLQGASDPATQNIEITSLPDLCTGKTTLWDFVIFS